MSKIIKSSYKSTDNKYSLEKAFLTNKEAFSLLRVKKAEDFEKAIDRIKEIAGRSYALKPFPERFEKMGPKKRAATVAGLAKLYHIIYHRVNFQKEYASLSQNEKEMVARQILMIYHFGMSKGNKKEKIPDSVKDFYWKRIEAIMAENGAVIDRKIHAPVSKDAKKIIRWDSYGVIERQKPEDLSDVYNGLKDKKVKHNFKPSKYDLYSSPAWVYTFAQFKNFADTENKVKEALAASSIPPSLLPELNAFDIADVLYNTYGSQEYRTAKLFSGSKFEFVKEIGKLYKNEIIAAHKKMGIDERYTRSLVREMIRFGVSSNVTPLEFIATKEAIENFEAQGIDCTGLEAGKEYPDEFYDVLFANNAYQSIIAKDEFGNQVTGPEYDVDHKETVDDCGELKIQGFDHPNLNAVNRWPRYRLVERNMHQYFIHIKDRVRSFGEKEESYVSRVHLPDKDVVMMFGIDKSMWLSHDMSKYPYVKEQDKYFRETYIPQVRSAENIGKVRYVEPQIFGQESLEYTKKKGKNNDDYGNSRMLNAAIAAKRGKSRR